MAIQGTNLSDKNVRLRFFSVVFMGIMALGAVLYWRQVELSSAEYVQIDSYRGAKKNDSGMLRSNKYQIDVEETSPSVN